MVLGTNFVLGLVSFDCRLSVLEYFFRGLFLKQTALSSFFQLLKPDQCLDFFVPYLLPSHVKCNLKFSKISAILKQRQKLFHDDINCVSVP